MLRLYLIETLRCLFVFAMIWLAFMAASTVLFGLITG